MKVCACAYLNMRVVVMDTSENILDMGGVGNRQIQSPALSLVDLAPLLASLAHSGGVDQRHDLEHTGGQYYMVVYSIHSVVYHTPHTMHHTPFTKYHTLNTPHTIRLSPYAISHTPYTICIPQPSGE